MAGLHTIGINIAVDTEDKNHITVDANYAQGEKKLVALNVDLDSTSSFALGEALGPVFFGALKGMGLNVDEALKRLQEKVGAGEEESDQKSGTGADTVREEGE